MKKRWQYLAMVIVVFGATSLFQYYEYGVENITWSLNVFYGFIAYWLAEYILED